MTDYNTIADTMIDADSFAIQDLFFYLRDNPIAMAEGAASAPKIKHKSKDLFNDYVLDYFGGGALGDVTINSNTTLQPGAREYENFTVNPTYTLTKGNDYPGPLIIKCSDTLVISGKIEAKNNFTKYDSGASGGSGGGGWTGTKSAATDPTDVADGVDGVNAGNAGNAGNDAEADGLEALLTTSKRLYNGASPGSNGTDGSSGNGGAAGIGGGVIILIADQIVFHGTGQLDVSGDDGSAGTGNSGGGGGGGGGLILMFYRTLTTDLGTYTTAGGSGGGGSYPGGDGGAGYTFKKNIAQS